MPHLLYSPRHAICTVLPGNPVPYFLFLPSPAILVLIMVSFHAHSFHCFYWTLTREEGILSNPSIGNNSDFIRYPAGKFASWKTTEKGQWYNYRHSEQCGRKILGEGKVLSSSGHLHCLCEADPPPDNFHTRSMCQPGPCTWFCLKTTSWTCQGIWLWYLFPFCP